MSVNDDLIPENLRHIRDVGKQKLNILTELHSLIKAPEQAEHVNLFDCGHLRSIDRDDSCVVTQLAECREISGASCGL